uniref:Uncharacterized protein n=1 Tax=Lepeophtheirus salmonis TaxID=72036 RepID=A0A0K2V1U9_LEPSM
MIVLPKTILSSNSKCAWEMIDFCAVSWNGLEKMGFHVIPPCSCPLCTIRVFTKKSKAGIGDNSFDDRRGHITQLPFQKLPQFERKGPLRNTIVRVEVYGGRHVREKAAAQRKSLIQEAGPQVTLLLLLLIVVILLTLREAEGLQVLTHHGGSVRPSRHNRGVVVVVLFILIILVPRRQVLQVTRSYHRIQVVVVGIRRPRAFISQSPFTAAQLIPFLHHRIRTIPLRRRPLLHSIYYLLFWTAISFIYIQSLFPSLFLPLFSLFQFSFLH